MGDGDAAAGDMLAAALAYVDAGWPVFPCEGKHPRVKNGLHDASTDRTTILRWWERVWPGANVAVRTGAESGLVVLDVDPEHGGDESLHELEREHGELPATVECLTGGGGRHIYFQHPDGNLRNSAGKLGAGLDTRANGGFVVAPPSAHLSGEPYEWRTAPDELPLAPVPPWLLERLAASGADANGGATPAPEIRDGERNERLFRYGCRLRRDGADHAEVRGALLVFNLSRCRPPLAEPEVERIAESATRYAAGGSVAAGRRRYTFSQLLELPDPHWLIRGILTEDALAVLYGAPGSGKSFLALDWALHVARGAPWLGHEVRRGAVAYVVAEGVGGWSKRARAWHGEHGSVDDEEFAALSPGVNLLDPSDTDALRAELEALPIPPALLVIDTLARCLVGGDENSAQDVGSAIAALDRLRAERGASVLAVHHTAKAEEAEERGSSALRGAADAMFKLAWDEDHLRLSCTKQKDAAELDPLELELEPREGSCVVTRSLGRSGPTPSEASLLSTLLGFGEGGASTTALRDAAGLPKTTFYRTVNALVDSGDIERRRHGNRTDYVPRVSVDSHSSTESQEQAGPSPGTGPVPVGDGPRDGTTAETGAVPQEEWDS